MQRLCKPSSGICNPSSDRERSLGAGPTERSAVFGNARNLRTSSATRVPARAALSYPGTAAPEATGNRQRDPNKSRCQGPTVPALTGINVPRPISNSHTSWPSQYTAPTYQWAPKPAATEPGGRRKCIREPIWRSWLPIDRHGRA